MDDLQTLVERNASGREAEARQAESVLRSELGRFERWLGSQDVTPTVASLRERATEIVDRVLARTSRAGSRSPTPIGSACRRWRGRSRAVCCTSPPCA